MKNIVEMQMKIADCLHMKEYASDQSRILVADLSLMNRREIKNRIAFKIWTAVPRVENYKIGAAVQI